MVPLELAAPVAGPNHCASVRDCKTIRWYSFDISHDSVPITTIPLDTRVRDRLKKYGTMGMTYNEILTRVLDAVDKDAFLAEIRHRAATNKKWVRLEDL